MGKIKKVENLVFDINDLFMVEMGSLIIQLKKTLKFKS